jgi:trimeric autotransporter adhesin
MAGHLTFTKLAVSDLRKTESLFASNDPYCKVLLNGDSFKTPAIKNGGSSAAWPGPLQLAVPSSTDLKEVRIEVWQDNSSKKKTDDVLIGFGTISVNDITAAAAAGLAKTAALSYEKKGKLDGAGKFSAQVAFTATPTAPTPAPAAPAAATTAVVQAAVAVTEPAAVAAAPAAATPAIVTAVAQAAAPAAAAMPVQAVAAPTAAVTEPLQPPAAAPAAAQPIAVQQSTATAAAAASDRQLKLTHLAASELRHTEAGFRLTANNDPYIKFITKSATVRTSTIKNGGSSGQWSEEYTLNISNSTSLNEPVLCEVWNCNVNDGKNVPDVLIGSGELLIGNLVANAAAGCAKSVLLVASDGKTASGKISCTAALISTATAALISTATAAPTVAAAAAAAVVNGSTAATAATTGVSGTPTTAGTTAAAAATSSSNSSSGDVVQLRIHSVSGSGLKDHSSRKGISTKYLYIKHSCAGKQEHSDSIDGSSKHGCTWSNETVITAVPADCNPLRSEIWCDNSNLATVTQDTMLGWCEFNISKLTVGVTEGSSFEVPISYEEGGKFKSKGALKLVAVKEPVAVPTAKAEPKTEPAAVRVHRASVDTSNLNGRLLLSGLSAVDMPETESILLGGKQDPFVRAYLQCHAAAAATDTQHKQETSVQLKGGRACAWSGETLVLSDATTAALQSGLVLDVWNKNDFKKDDLIGTVTVQYDALQALIAKSVAASSSGRAQQTQVKLCRPGARGEGILTLSVAFEAADATKTIPTATAASAAADRGTTAASDAVQSDVASTTAAAVAADNSSFVPDATGTFMLSAIQARDLAETENFAARLVGNKQDPLVIAKLGAVEGRTTVRNNAGTAVDWGEEVIALLHSTTVLDSAAELTLEVVNSNVLKDASIGKVRVLLTQLQSAVRLGHTDQCMTLSLPLSRDNGKKKTVEKGSVTLQLKFVPRDSAVAVVHQLNTTAAVGDVNAGSSSAVAAVAEAGVRAAGYIRLYELSATDLPNTEGLLQLGKQDPYIVARYVNSVIAISITAIAFMFMC